MAGIIILNNEKTPKPFGDSLGKKTASNNPVAKNTFTKNTIRLKNESFFNDLNYFVSLYQF